MKNRVFYLLIAFYIVIFLWWLRLQIFDIRESTEVYLFGAIYPVIALLGGVNGVFSAQKWGGWSSALGKSIIFFSIGLLGLWFGQTVWSYYNIIAHVEIPYPALSDIGYVSIIPLYALGSIYLGAASGAKVGLKTRRGRLQVLAIFVATMIISYLLFSQNLSLDLQQPLRSFLDVMYTFGEAITIFITVSVFILCSTVLGGNMRNKVLFLILALSLQYLTDYAFLLMTYQGTYHNGGVVDLMYATSFLVTAVSLMNLRHYR